MYHGDADVQVVAEVFATQDIVVKPHVMLSLVLYKIVDTAQVPMVKAESVSLISSKSDATLQEVRDDALHMLDVLSTRVWKDGRASSPRPVPPQQPEAGSEIETSQGRVAVVIGNLQDSYQQFQYQLSAKLARSVYRSCSFLMVQS